MRRLIPLLRHRHARARGRPRRLASRNTPVAAYGGVLAWSDYDAATQRYVEEPASGGEAADAQSDPAAYPGASAETPVGDTACPDGDDCG